MCIGSIFYNAPAISSVTPTTELYSIKRLGAVDQPKDTTLPMQLGRQIRHNNNVSEILFKPDLSMYPVGTIITSATFTYEVIALSLQNTAGTQLEILLCTSSWTESPTSPVYSTFPQWGWGWKLQTDPLVWGYNFQYVPITVTFQCNYGMVAQLNSWISNPSTNNGFILQLNCSSQDYITVNNIYLTLTV